MEISTIIALAVGVALGGSAGVLLTKVAAGARSAALLTERALLRERVQDLESGLAHDRELAAILTPLRDGLGRLERQVGVLERDRTEQYARLGEQLVGVAAAGEAVRSQTAALAGALSSSTTRGAWGEMQLRRVVEHAGMLARVDFTEQASASAGAHGPVRHRPDLVVHLPGGKNIVVDAKAPMTSFLVAQADSRPAAEREEAMRAHARALRGHVDALGAKAYWAAFTPCPELVVCFVPGEAMLAAALAADPGLHDHAMSKRVVLASPATLLALLHTVAYTWQQEALTGSARELFEVGRELYGRLGTLGGHVSKLGRTIHRAVEDYNAMVGTLERRVLVQARRMHDLDVVSEALSTPEPVEASLRPLTAHELLDEAS